LSAPFFHSFFKLNCKKSQPGADKGGTGFVKLRGCWWVRVS